MEIINQQLMLIIHGIEKGCKKPKSCPRTNVITYFGNSTMDIVFHTFVKYVNEHLKKEKTKHHVILVSMTKI